MNEHQTVTAIGWIWLGLGVMAFVSGVGGFLVSTITGLPTSPLPMRSVPMDFLWQHYREGAVAFAFGLCIWTLSRAKILVVFRNSKPMA